jgi:hypothetical protein
MTMKHVPTSDIVLAAVLTCSLTLNSYAGNRSGTVAAQFLKIPTNARAVGMGNAQVSLAEGASSIAYNPAGVLSIATASFGGTYNQWFADISHMFYGVAVNLQEYGTVGFGVTVLTTDDMTVTTPAFPEGTGELFKAAEFAYTFTYARQISQDFGLGLSARYIKSNLYNKDIGASSVAFDIGTLYDIAALRTRLGISVNNLGRDLKYLNEQYSLPTALRFGARTTVYEDEGNLVYAVAQIARPNDAEEQYNIGLEYTYSSIVSLRGGYRFNYDTENVSGGLGVNLNSLGLNGMLDYAYTNYKYLPGTHMFSIELGF